MKKIILTYVFFLLSIGYSFIYANSGIVQSLNDIVNNISSKWWSNWSVVSFPTSSSIWSFWGYYVNNNPNFDTIQWNYLSWYYYDSTYGFFKLNWDTNTANNVQVVNSSASADKCNWTTSYKFSWYAKWADLNGNSTADAWYIDFDYAEHHSNPAYSDIYVYYCSDDKKLHWYAYSSDLWFQNFEWLSVDIFTQWNVSTLLIKKDDPFFVNNFTDILNDTYWSSSWNSVWNWNSNIQWDIITKETWKEMIFYITK